MTTQTDINSLLQARYGADAPSLPDVAEDPALALLLSHRSVRAYTPQPVPAQALEMMIAAAQSASTSSNLQTWSVVAVEDAGRRDRLARLSNDQAFIRQAPLFLAWIADLARLDALGAR